MNEIIIDTIVLDYLSFNQKKLTEKAFTAIQNADAVYVSISSLWELGNHVRDGLITIDIDFDVFYQNILSQFGIILLETQWKALNYFSTFEYQIISKPWTNVVNDKIINGIKQELRKDWASPTHSIE